MNLSIDIQDKATPAVHELLSKTANTTALHAAMGMGVETLVLRHIRTVLVPKGNKSGGTSTGFWKKAAQSVVGNSTATDATVSIRQRGVALQYYGGTVKPSGRISDVTGRPITRLAVPLDASAHGKMPGDFPKDSLICIGNILARKVGRAKDAPLIAMFALVRSVRIKPHPDVLPPEDQIREAAQTAASKYIRRNLRNA